MYIYITLPTSKIWPRGKGLDFLGSWFQDHGIKSHYGVFGGEVSHTILLPPRSLTCIPGWLYLCTCAKYHFSSVLHNIINLYIYSGKITWEMRMDLNNTIGLELQSCSLELYLRKNFDPPKKFILFLNFFVLIFYFGVTSHFH